MNGILLVAAREYRQVAATRGFWVMLLFLPLVIAVSQLAGRLIDGPDSVAYVLVDGSNKYGDLVTKRLELNAQRRVLGDLSAYAQRWKVGDASPNSTWASGRRWFTDDEVQGFIDAGGAEAALPLIKPKLPSEAPVFEIREPYYVRAAAPTTVEQGPAALSEALAPALKGEDIAIDAEKKLPLELAIFIPKDFGSAPVPVQIWTSGRPDNQLIETVRNELTVALRSNALQASGLPPEAATQIQAIAAPLTVSAPAAGAGREQVAIRSVLPLGIAYLLLVAVMTTGGMMLQGTLEEKSNKLLESVLACVRPAELMYGKLLGLGAIGITIVAAWIGCAVIAAFAVQGVVADVVRPSLEGLSEPWMIPALLFYFLAGYLVISMIYLAIGALSKSMQDAQAYLMPVVMIVTMPIVFMMISVVQEPNGLLPTVLSWIPLYTPFAMLARLGGGVSLMEVLGTGAVLALFVIVEMWFLGKLFQANLLSTGQQTKLGGFLMKLSGKKAKAA